MPPFVHLHLHSHYSLLDSTIRIPELVQQVAAAGMPAVAITDHGNLFGAFQFHRAALDAGLRPVIGCEVYVAPGDHRAREGKPTGQKRVYDHLVLLAENDTGYRNLVWLVSEAYLEGFYYKPRISKELLADHSEGLIGLSACLSGEVSRRLLGRDQDGAVRAAEEYREILGSSNFFLEIQDHGTVDEEFVRQGMVEVSRKTGIPLVATNDCHFHRREDLFAHKMLIGIGQGNTLDELVGRYAYNDQFYVRSPREMYELFADYPGACERTAGIAERCHVLFDTSTAHLPSYPVPEGSTPASYLGEVAREGLEWRLARRASRQARADEYRKRLAHELEIIDRMGFPGYFLVVWDFIRYAREHEIPVGPGRGSAAGSVVSWALRVTDIDPLEHDLLFERFLNPDRISMPDIDIDFCQRRRNEMIEYVRQRYGADSVAQIATFNILKAKSAVRDVGRVMGMPFGDVDRIAKLIPDELNITIEQALKDSPDLRRLVEGDDDVRQLVETAAKLEGLARHSGVHAAGVVIAPEPLRNLVPIFTTRDGEVATQFDKDDVETLGLLKMDFLGLRTLTVISDALENIARTEGTAPELDEIPFDDPAVYELFSAGDTDGIFQFESSGMKDVLRKVQPRVFADLAALNALYRPGPMQFIDDYAARKHGSKSITYIFPELEEILAETYGIIVFQEQVMRIAVKIAGFSMAKADTLRKAMGKKKKEIIDREGENFVAGAVANGFPEDKVRKLWEQIVPFAQYGFNKSHSVAYAHVAYITAWLKAHYPAHFMAAMLTSEASNSDKLRMYLGRCRQMGLEILPPDINASEEAFTVEGEGIRFGLIAVKGVGENAVQAIMEARRKEGSFTSVAHFLRSLPARAVNHKVVECLAKAGCFDAFGITRKGLVENLEHLLELTNREREDAQTGQGFLFDTLPSEKLEADLAGVEAADDAVRLAWEREVLEFYLSGHPLDRYARALERFADGTVAELPLRLEEGGETATVGGLINDLKRIVIRKEGKNQGRTMATFHLEDATGSVRVVVFPDAFDLVGPRLDNGAPVLVTASLRGEGEHVELMAEEVVPLDGIESRRAAAFKVVLDLDAVDEARLEELRELLLAHPGELPVRFELVRRGAFRARLVPPPALRVEPSGELKTALDELLGRGRYEFEFEARPANGRRPAVAPVPPLAGEPDGAVVN